MARPDTRRPKSDSIDSPIGLTYAVASIGKEHSVPTGYTLDDEHERGLWEGIIKGRSYSGWRHVDLVMIVRYIKIASRLRNLEEVMQQPDGMFCESDSGRLEVHPAVKAYKILLELQVRAEKSLQLDFDGVDNRLATQLKLPGMADMGDTILEMQSEDGLLA